jgi:large subunit ribosomal protein L14
MIQPQTCLNAADNSGAKKVMCIRVLGGKRYGRVGDVFIGVVKRSTPNLPVKRSDVVRAVVVRTKQAIRRKDGSQLRFDDNACVVLNKDNNPRGTRVLGSVAREIKEKGFVKIATLAAEAI